MRDGDGEMFATNFLVKRRRIFTCAFEDQRLSIFAMGELAADAGFLSAACAGFGSRKCGGSQKPANSSRQQEQSCPV